MIIVVVLSFMTADAIFPTAVLFRMILVFLTADTIVLTTILVFLNANTMFFLLMEGVW